MGRKKNPRGRRKKRKARVGRLGPGLKHKLSTMSNGAELGARVTGAELPAMSPPRWLRAQELSARDSGTEQCKLGVIMAGAEIRVQILKSL